MKLRKRLLPFVLALVTVSLVGVVPVHAQEGERVRATPAELRASADSAEQTAVKRETRAAHQLLRAAVLEARAVSKGRLANRLNETASRIEARADRRPDLAGTLNEKASALRARARNLNDAYRALALRGREIRDRAAEHLEVAARKRAKAAALRAAADKREAEMGEEEPPFEEEQPS